MGENGTDPEDDQGDTNGPPLSPYARERDAEIKGLLERLLATGQELEQAGRTHVEDRLQLTGYIAADMARSSHEGALDGWFFLRYALLNFHIDIRNETRQADIGRGMIDILTHILDDVRDAKGSSVIAAKGSPLAWAVARKKKAEEQYLRETGEKITKSDVVRELMETAERQIADLRRHADYEEEHDFILADVESGRPARRYIEALAERFIQTAAPAGRLPDYVANESRYPSFFGKARTVPSMRSIERLDAKALVRAAIRLAGIKDEEIDGWMNLVRAPIARAQRKKRKGPTIRQA